MNGYIKTTILFSILTALFITVGYFIGGTSGLIIMLIFSIVINFGTYWFSDKIAIKFAKAKPINKDDLGWIYDEIDILSKKMNIPTPKVYISPSDQPNAFATGRNKKNGVVCLTTGLISNLQRNEIRGVIAHELAHIKNNDILIATVAAVIAGVIASIGDLFIFNMIFGGNDEEGSNPIGTLLLIIIAPIAAVIIQLSISRTREYLADRTAAKFTGEPEALANALVKIESLVKINPMQTNPALANLYIQNPISIRGIGELFSTHPPTAKRVKALMSLK
mgnify:CR=1 FL=1